MFVDASALVAILTAENGYKQLAECLRSASNPITSGFAMFETVMALCRKSRLTVEDAEIELRRFLAITRITIIAISDAETRAALAAHSRYGKGRGHPAQLNMGDCFAYACARTHDVPLLYLGNDFAQTDIRSATA